MALFAVTLKINRKGHKEEPQRSLKKVSSVSEFLPIKIVAGVVNKILESVGFHTEAQRRYGEHRESQLSTRPVSHRHIATDQRHRNAGDDR